MVSAETDTERGRGREDERMRWEEIVNCCCHTLAGTVKPGCFLFLFFPIFFLHLKGNNSG